MPVLLGEKDVRAVLSMDDLIGAMETALDQFSDGRVRQPLRSIVEVAAHTPSTASCRRICRPAGARHQARVGLPFERGARAAVPSRDHRPAGSGDRRTAGGDGRPLHHGSADGRGLGRIGQAPGAARCPRARRAGHRRAGAQPHRRAHARQAVRGAAGLGPRCRAGARADRRARARYTGARDRLRVAARGGRRRRRHRAGDGVPRTGPRADVGP